MKTKTIRVCSNPYAGIDHEGRAQGAVLMEGHADRYVGATYDHEETAKEGRHLYVFSAEPVVVPLTPYYRRKVEDGDLLAADAESALACGIKKESFAAPEDLLAHEHDRIAEEYEERHGEPPHFARPARKTHASTTPSNAAH